MKTWEARTTSGSIINEVQINWGKLGEYIGKGVYGKVNHLCLGIHNESKEKQFIVLPENMEEYIQGKTASSIMGSDKVELESRYIGFKYGNIIVKVRVDEKTNNISIEVDSA